MKARVAQDAFGVAHLHESGAQAPPS
jgi:hypothetical protein